MSSISETKQQVQQQKEIISRQQQQVRAARSRLPNVTSQRALRSGQYGEGIAGKTKRQKVIMVGKGLSAQEQSLAGAEKQISSYEQQIKQAENVQGAYQRAADLVSQGEPPDRYDSPLVKDIWKELNKQRTKYAGFIKSLVLDRRQAISDINAQLPSNKLLAFDDKENAFIKDLKTGEVISIPEYNRAIQESQTFQSTVPQSVPLVQQSVLSNVLINPSTNLPYGEVQPVAQPKGTLESLRAKLSQSSFERTQRPQNVLDKTIGVAQGFGVSLLGQAITGKNLILNPVDTTKEIVSGAGQLGYGLITGTARAPIIGRVLASDPTYALGYTAGEIVGAKGVGEIVSFGGKKIINIGTRLNPKYINAETGVLENIPTSAGYKRIELVRGVSDVRESLPSQTKLSGQTIDAVSGQRGLFSQFRNEIVVNKPLPTPESSILESSFFADPRARLRTSRLLLNQERASLLDVLAGDVTFRGTKPQALIFPETPVENFPYYLRDVENKLSRGIPLNTAEQKRLLDWQLTPSNKFKPIGFLSTEPEVTLPPSEIIKRESKVGVTLINGKVVPIYEASIGKASSETSNLLEKLRNGKISESEINKLIKNLKKESGIDYSDYLNYARVSPSLPIGATGTFASSLYGGRPETSNLFGSSINYQVIAPSNFLSNQNIQRNISVSPESIIPTSGTSNILSPSAPADIINLSVSKSPEKRSPSNLSPITNIPKEKIPVPIIPPSKSYLSDLQPLEDSNKSYDVGVIRNKKPTIIKKGLYRNDALDYGAERVLKTLAATFFIKPSRSKPKDLPDTEVFNRNREFFRRPVSKSKLNDLGEVYIQKKRKVGGRGSRLGSKQEIIEIMQSKNQLSLFGNSKGKKIKFI